MLSEEDARCCATLWLVAICVRGPILYLNELRVNTWRWSLGATHGKFGPALMLAFWCTLAAIAMPGSPLLLALASGLTAIHQVRGSWRVGKLRARLRANGRTTTLSPRLPRRPRVLKASLAYRPLSKCPRTAYISSMGCSTAAR